MHLCNVGLQLLRHLRKGLAHRHDVDFSLTMHLCNVGLQLLDDSMLLASLIFTLSLVFGDHGLDGDQFLSRMSKLPFARLSLFAHRRLTHVGHLNVPRLTSSPLVVNGCVASSSFCVNVLLQVNTVF